jgi:hypothetical protein
MISDQLSDQEDKIVENALRGYQMALTDVIDMEVVDCRKRGDDPLESPFLRALNETLTETNSLLDRFFGGSAEPMYGLDENDNVVVKGQDEEKRGL